MSMTSTGRQFHLVADQRARDWLVAHPDSRPRVIAYDVHHCCGGGKICRVHVRGLSSTDDAAAFSMGTLEDGSMFLIDRRAAARLPSRFGLTVRGFGRLKHLDLDLEAGEWGRLLYD